jgi:Flp pilus assembly protein CpaB
MNHSSREERNISIAIIAIIAALGLLGVVAVTIVTIPLQQQAEAAGCKTSVAVNASKGRCFGHGP